MRHGKENWDERLVVVGIQNGVFVRRELFLINCFHAFQVGFGYS